MIKSIVRIALAGLIFYSFSIDSYAQQTKNAPYSFGGIGLLTQGGFLQNQFMGGLGSSLEDNANYNLKNPASLHSLDFTNLQYGSSLVLATQFDGTDTGRYKNGHFNYVSLAFPIFKKIDAGIAIGLRPKSTMGYFMQFSGKEFGYKTLNTFEGRGGLNQLDIAYGMKIYKGFSLGASLQFLFGQTGQVQDKQFETVNVFSIKSESFSYYNGVQAKVGVQYNGQMTKKIRHGFGAYFEFGGSLKVESDRLVRTYNAGAKDPYFIDTIAFEENEAINLAMPTGFGLAYHIENKDKWMFGGEYNVQHWSDFKGVNSQIVHFDREVLSVGGYYQPASFGDTKRGSFGERLKYYFGTTRYYFGYRQEKTYTGYLDKRIIETGINFGLGLPVVRYYKDPRGIKIPVVSRVYVGGEYLKRGAIDNGLIQENIWKIKVGLTFSDKWFIKKKYQ